MTAAEQKEAIEDVFELFPMIKQMRNRMAGSLGGMAAAAGIGHLLQLTGQNYTPLLTAASVAYLFAWFVIQVLVPRLAPARLTTTGE